MDKLLKTIDSLIEVHHLAVLQPLVDDVRSQFQDCINGDEVAIFWHVEDIQCRIDDDYSDYHVEDYHDCTIGINWDVIDCHIEMFEK